MYNNPSKWTSVFSICLDGVWSWMIGLSPFNNKSKCMDCPPRQRGRKFPLPEIWPYNVILVHKKETIKWLSRNYNIEIILINISFTYSFRYNKIAFFHLFFFSWRHLVDSNGDIPFRSDKQITEKEGWKERVREPAFSGHMNTVSLDLRPPNDPRHLWGLTSRGVRGKVGWEKVYAYIKYLRTWSTKGVLLVRNGA